MAIPLLGELQKFIVEHGSAVVLQEHLALFKSKLEMLGEQVEKLEKENAKLTARNLDLEQAFAKKKKANELVESHGALFRRLEDGTFDETPLCPKCHATMWCFDTFHNLFPWECSDEACGRKANIKGCDLKNVIAKLPR